VFRQAVLGDEDTIWSADVPPNTISISFG
jgi:hypothetical protein